MHFTAVLVAAIACVTGVTADLHDHAWCANREFKGNQESNPEVRVALSLAVLLSVAHTSGSQNNAATDAACIKYRNRNTGKEQWDTCPDCTSGVLADFTTQSSRGDLRVCNSPGWHIGGDEWEYYCKQSGADLGKA
ncbi:hypothetical protein KVR01_007770 [Diaporthe batatas]|uniref:uncharacterized protein n=1 Tax=Diaporthe batatas TaxID=748121 RepID=UPI001D051606|nr:uncharacterized protein KVR01_007770 [Diaporthe batatas]KAG8162005.1 hypothetical protein KVR01_007770 [Diaporthe batatas]